VLAIETKAAGSVLDGADPKALLRVDLRNLIKAAHWAHQIEMLKVLEWVCGTDRQFDHARKAAMKLINDEERAIFSIIDSQVMGVGKETDK